MVASGMSGRRVLLSGAAGFVGSVLARRLLAEGHEVHALLKSGSSKWRLEGVAQHIRVHEVDLKDEQALRAVIAAARPELVFHLAAHGAYPFQSDANETIQTNILGTWNLLRATAQIEYEVFVNTGSSSEYGFKDFAMRESDLLEPNSYYSVAKCAQTLLCQHFAKTEKRPITTFRLFSAFGPFEEPSRLIPTLISRCLGGKDLELVSREIARDFVYVEDVVDAYLSLDKLAGLSGEIINIGTGVQSTIGQVVDAVLEHTGAKVRCLWEAMPARAWDARTWVADCTKSRRLLSWRPRTSLSDGLARTVAWTRERSNAKS
jgi:nucleoside-diphosphate-sugar epimerase